MLFPLHWLLSLLATFLRAGAGRGGPPQAVPDADLPTLYEFEGCPYCKIAREAISHAGMSVLVRPCPKRGKRFRPRVAELGGKQQFPYLVDFKPGEGMYESGDIARAVLSRFATSRPFIHALGPLSTLLAQYAILFRLLSGTFAKSSKEQQLPLEFHGAERHPGARLVKERLCELELEYIWHPGHKDVCLTDPNQNITLKGARAAYVYLATTYQA